MGGLIHPQDVVSGYTQPIYDWVLAHTRELIVIVTIIVILRILTKARKRLKARKYQKEKAGSTNEWFSWKEYDEWKRARQNENQNQ